MMEFEFGACEADAAKLSLYVATALALESFVPVDVLNDLCDNCKDNIADAMRDEPPTLEWPTPHHG